MTNKPLRKPKADITVISVMTSTHNLGCTLESIAEILRYRGLDKEAEKLEEIASRIK